MPFESFLQGLSTNYREPALERCEVPCDYTPTGKSPFFLAKGIFMSLIHELADEKKR
jgi:hypothetical protein